MFSVGFLISSRNGSLARTFPGSVPCAPQSRISSMDFGVASCSLVNSFARIPAQSSLLCPPSQGVVPRLRPEPGPPFGSTSLLPFACGLAGSRASVRSGVQRTQRRNRPLPPQSPKAVPHSQWPPTLLFSVEGPRVHTDHPGHGHGWGRLQHHGYGHRGNPRCQ